MKGVFVSCFVILLNFCVYESEQKVVANNSLLSQDKILRQINYQFPNVYMPKLVNESDAQEYFDPHIYEISVNLVYTNCLMYMGDQNCMVFDEADTMSCVVRVHPDKPVPQIKKYTVSCDRHVDVKKVLELQAKLHFIEFVKRYKKSYANDASHLAQRFNMFRDNIKKFGLKNAQEEGSATYRVTMMTDRKKQNVN